MTGRESADTGRVDEGENAALLGKYTTWYPKLSRAAPAWIIPVIFLYNLSRGMVTSPKVEVFTRIACQQLLPEEFPLFGNLNGSTPEKCLLDPDVQKATADLQAKVYTLMAILTTFTAGRWGRLGDEHGRRIVLVMTTIGALCTDALFLIASNSRSPSFGSTMLLLTPFIEGTLGGLATYFASTHAYISDSTSHGSRATVFAFTQGIMYLGLALGPELAGAVLHFLPWSTVSTIFIINFGCFFLNLLFILVILPESVPRDRLRPWIAGTHSADASTSGSISIKLSLSNVKEGIIKFFSPLALFLPSRRPRGNRDRDWSLTFFALAIFMYDMSMGLYSVKYLYAKHTFGWNAEQLGYYVSYIWVVRAVYLLALLPVVVKYIKSRRSSISHTRLHHAEVKFDIILAASQFSADVVANTLVLIGPSHSTPAFLTFMTIAVLASGAMPVMNSVGASLLHSLGKGSSTGQLYGAMSVLSSITHTLQPFIFSSLYGATVGTFSKAIFLLAACLVAGCVVLLVILTKKCSAYSAIDLPDNPPPEGESESL